MGTEVALSEKSDPTARRVAPPVPGLTASLRHILYYIDVCESRALMKLRAMQTKLVPRVRRASSRLYWW